MEFVAEMDQLGPMLDFIRNGAQKNTISSADLYKLELASEEAIVNVIHYAYPDKKNGIWIDLHPAKDHFEIHIRDRGIPFNPLDHKPDIQKNLPLEERKVGGLGIFLIGELIDKVAYQRKGDENHLTLYIKYSHET